MTDAKQTDEDSQRGAEFDPPSTPSPERSAEDVVRAQIQALVGTAQEDGDEANLSGVRTLFAFASPMFRTSHGSVSSFADALSTPIHRPLFGAAAIERGPVDRTDERFVQTVLARSDSGDRTYEFVLERQSTGKYEGCWMTESISLVYNGVSPSFRRMPTVQFGDAEIKCDQGDRLRDVLLRTSGYSPHNDAAQVANCGGNGLCGTCAVEVCGETSEMGSREKARLDLPPHDGDDGLRLSCQTEIHGDVTVRKHDGLWGQHVDEQLEAGEDSIEGIELTEAEYDGTFDYETSGERR